MLQKKPNTSKNIVKNLLSERGFLFFIYIYIKQYITMISDKKLHKIIQEELTKTEVNSMIDKKMNSSLESNDFKKAVKKISAAVISELFKTLWQRNSTWVSTISR